MVNPTSAGIIGGGMLAGAAGNIFGAMANDSGIDEAMDLLKEYYGLALEQPNLSHRFAKKQYKQIAGLYAPYMAGGLDALKKFSSTLSMPVGGSPLYQWRSKQGNEAIDRAMATRGLYGSRSSIDARSDLNQALTGEETDKLYGRLQNAIQLLGHYGTGGVAGAKQGMIQSRWQKGQGLSDLYTQLGQLLSGLQLQKGQNKAGLYSSLGAMPLQGYGMYKTVNSPLYGG